MKVNIGKYQDLPTEERKVDMQIENFDFLDFNCVNMIILEWLKEFKKCRKHDIPGGLKIYESIHQNYDLQYAFDFYVKDNPTFDQCQKEWDDILDKMIWSFNEIITQENSTCYYEILPEIDWEGTKNNVVDDQGSREVLWKVKGEINEVKRQKYYDRIDEGLDLFRKHIRDLWD